MSIDLEFLTTASENDSKFSIKGIPDKLWQVFCEAAKNAMPEKGNLAWASVLTEIIQKHVEGNVYTYIMTDIPQEARQKFEQAARQADLTMDHIIGVMFKQAMSDKLHILNMISEEAKDGYRVLVIAGLSDIAWAAWEKTALGVHLAPEELIGMMFEAAAGGTLKLEPFPVDPHEYNYEQQRK